MSTRQCSTLALVFGFAVVIVLAVLSASYVLITPVIPGARLRQLRPGMTKAEVTAILGPPQVIEGDEEWVYSRWGNPGWVEVYFDGNGRFDRLNDESPFRW